MRIRHEVLIWDLPLDAEPNEVLSFPDFCGNLTTELISISNYDELTDEDLPSLLIRQERDVILDPHIALEFAASRSESFISTDYSSAQRQCAAVRTRRQSVTSSSPNDFRMKYPNWRKEISRFDHEFTQNALSLYNTLRWSSGYLGDTGDGSDRIMLADIDTHGWAVLSSSREGLSLYNWDFGPVRLDATTHPRLQDLITRERQEPLARNLLREAAQHRISSPRVALIMAVAAAEAAVKGFIAERLPIWSQALVVDAQQLSLNKILSEVIPDFLESNFDFANPKLPRESVVTPIWKAIESRNIAIHQPPDSPKSQALAEDLSYKKVIGLFTAVSDLLYFLDFFAGESWALQKVSTQSREDWLRRNPPG